MSGFNCSQGEFDRLFITEAEMVDRYIGASLYTWGYNNSSQYPVLPSPDGVISTPMQISTNSTWKQLTVSPFQYCAVKTDGTLWGWGYNPYGQLGINNTNTQNTPTQEVLLKTTWKQVSTGWYHTAAIETNGTLWCCGRIQEGQLGNNITGISPADDKRTFVAVGTDMTWKHVSCGGYHTAAVKTDGSLWTWGYNTTGELGLGDSGSGTHRSIPTRVGIENDWKSVECFYYGTKAIKTDGTLWVWGNGSSSYLGKGVGNTTNYSSPVQTIVGGTDWKYITHDCVTALKTNGKIYSIAGDCLINAPASSHTWKYVSSGSEGLSLFGIKSDGTLWAWGWNASGILGTGQAINSNYSVPTQINGIWKNVDSYNVSLGIKL